MITAIVKRPTAVIVLLALAALLAGTAALAERPEPEVYGTFDGDEMFTLLPPNGIPAIMDPEYVTGEEAAAQMSAEEHVMGLATDRDAVCWSTWQLDHHEIVNDVFDGAAIAATW
jgi:hypothetical protein